MTTTNDRAGRERADRGARAMSVVVVCAAASLAAASPPLPAAPAGVRTSTEYGIEFVTVGDAGNAGYPGSTVNWTGFGNDRMGRGAVSYEYRIARSEVTSGQWLEFLNTFAPRPVPSQVAPVITPNNQFSEFYLGPRYFGGELVELNSADRTARYALRTDVPNAANLPVYGTGWRVAALYCNWLHNGKSSAWESLLSGAYDTTTWGTIPGTSSHTDDITPMPGARFWIPSLDEWGKAVFYDPNRFGPGQGGWWDNHYGSDTPPTPGLPGEPGAQSSVGVPLAPFSGQAMNIALGSYTSMSPWGLIDTAGGTSEIVSERTSTNPDTQFSVFTLGPEAGSRPQDPALIPEYAARVTRPYYGGGTPFQYGSTFAGLRIAAAVPSPGSFVIVAWAGVCWARRRRRA